ncbi:ATP-binding protein [Cellulomonas sp. C5510]|uniref:ATP-binding protein n=1 Tax=Cellulomonas sp. C5510 TaxID=2871170 RepID=UPI001C93FDD8|nr:ATP-binding protein [Cellulomonas sp. C5510]QZN85154.1 AAA family ATPase [Cellulomonas sp. C5510]
MFVGRSRELAALERQMDVVREGRRADAGVAVLLRGRRRVGKSRLVGELVRRLGVPTVTFQAARGAPLGQELALLAQAVADSDLPAADVARDSTPSTLTAALTLLAAALPDDTPSVVVLDEVPWLLEQAPGAAGELQRVWDARLSRKPVLLLLLGSDFATMERLTGQDQPFHARATEMVLDPLSPVEIGAMCGVSAFDAVDAYLVTGGLPLVAQEWQPGAPLEQFLESSFATSTSALVVSGSRVLDAEFGEGTIARQVLTAIGGRGERTFSGIQGAARGEPLNATTLTGMLSTLIRKRVVATDEPISTRAVPRNRRYRVADPSLRFWLAFVEPALGEVDRGRPDLALARVQRGFAAWRGRAVEPVVRSALERLLPDERFPEVTRVGGWWPRSNQPEIDLVGTAGAPGPVHLVGTVKWRAAAPVRADEVRALAADAVAVPGVTADTSLVAVCPGGAEPGLPLAATWGAEDLLAAWPR